MAAQHRLRRPRSARRGIAPVLVAVIVAAAIIGGATVYWLTRPAEVQPLGVVGTASIIDHVTVTYKAKTVFGVGQEYLEITVFLNSSYEKVDIYVLTNISNNIEVMSSHTEVANGSTITTQYTSDIIYILAVKDGYVDAIIVNPPDQPGQVVVSSEHYADPVSLAQHVKVKVRWWDIIREQWSGAWGLANALKFTGQVVLGMLPYAGALWVLWFFSAMVRSLSEYSVEPIMDFFYKNYQIIHGIYSLVLNVVLKMVDLITGPAT